MNPRAEAQARLNALTPGRYEARALEPSPPAVNQPPWYADDPVAGPARRGRLLVAPVPNADRTWDELAREEPSLAEWCADGWLGAWRPLLPIANLDAFVATRTSWHRLAEHVLTPWRHRVNGKVGLRFTRGGFGTPFQPGDRGDTQVRVEGGDVVVDDGQERRVRASTIRDVAGAVRVELGYRTDVYEPATTGDPDQALTVDEEAAARLADWFGFAASVLEAIRAGAPDAASTRLQLWPEHFDLSIDLGDEAAGSRGTFGASPGDEAHPLPYLYVTHWAEKVRYDRYWNDRTFGGASLGYDAVLDADDGRDVALAFLQRGRDLLGR